MKGVTKQRVGVSSSEPALSGRTRQTHSTLKGWLSRKLLLPTPLPLSSGAFTAPGQSQCLCQAELPWSQMLLQLADLVQVQKCCWSCVNKHSRRLQM